MFLVDDILFSPVKGLMLVCRQVQEAARRDLEQQQKNAMGSLSELHAQLESGRIDEEQFDAAETTLLEKLESINGILHGESPRDES